MPVHSSACVTKYTITSRCMEDPIRGADEGRRMTVVVFVVVRLIIASRRYLCCSLSCRALCRIYACWHRKDPPH